MSTTGGNGGAGGSEIVIEPEGGTGNTTTDSVCEGESIDVALEPVSLLVMFDRSKSMSSIDTIDPENGQSRWQKASSGLKNFVADLRADGLRVALRFFPHELPEPGCDSPTCDSAACAEPLVDLATLSKEEAGGVQERRLRDAINAATPAFDTEGGTPTGPALEGAVTWAKAHQAAHPEERTAILFVTDGPPEGCDEQSDSLDDYLSDALGEGVSTFFIGLTDAEGENLQQEDLNHLAEVGGTERAYFVEDGITAASDLLETLVEVRGQAIECDFPLPEFAASGEPIDPELVENVVHLFSNGFGSSVFTRVRDPADCELNASFYYDDEDHPMRIHFCPQACSFARADPKSTFRVVEECDLRKR